MENFFGPKSELERTQFWYSSIFSEPRSDDVKQELAYFLALFGSLYLLKDWFKRVSKIAAVPEFALSDALSKRHWGTLRDIVNRHKHLSLTDPSVDAQFSIRREYDPSLQRKWRLVVLAGPHVTSLDDIARSMMQAVRKHAELMPDGIWDNNSGNFA